MALNNQSLIQEANDRWAKALVDNKTLESKKYSDFIDDDYGRQIIDLVQEGGGVLGVGLVGYTYILEKAGLRISSYAGASAGAINATYLAAIDDSIYINGGTKSEETLKLLSDTKMSSFMDGNKLVKFILDYSLDDYGFKKTAYLFIVLFIALFFIIDWSYYTFCVDMIFKSDSNLNFIFKILGIIFIALLQVMMIKDLVHRIPNLLKYSRFGKLVQLGRILILTFNFGMLYLYIFQVNIGLINENPKQYAWTIGTLAVINAAIIYYKIISSFLSKNMGLHRGNIFLSWMKKSIDAQTNSKIDLPDIKGKYIQFDNSKIDSIITGRKLVLVTASYSQKKLVRLPLEAKEYFGDYPRTHPAEFVRASMSIPLFFDLFSPSVKLGDKENKFIDGGMLSNFPIRELDNKSLTCPRFPTFGVKLGREDLVIEELKESKQVLFRYLGNLLSTLRSFYDLEYQKENSEVKKLIGYIDTRDLNYKNKDINWLNFNLSENAQNVLFLNGVDAAIEFLKEFNWEEYKKLRCH
jgi:NTE family protein